MTNADWNKYIFNGKCPYTGKACQKDWDCDDCEVEKEEREFLKEIDEGSRKEK